MNAIKNLKSKIKEFLTTKLGRLLLFTGTFILGALIFGQTIHAFTYAVLALKGLVRALFA